MQPRHRLGSALVGLFLVFASSLTLPLAAQSRSAQSTVPNVTTTATLTPDTTPTQPALELLGSYYGGPSYEVELRGQYAYVGVGSRLDVLNVSNPGAPALVGKSEHLPHDIAALALSGDYGFAAYAAQGNNPGGLVSLDLSNPTSPLRVGSYIAGEGPYTVASPSDVAIAGNYAYLGQGYSGLRVLDVSDPTRPVRRGAWSGEAPQVELVGNYLYTFGGTEGDIHILDVSNPDSPTEVGTYAGSASDIEVVGQYAYVVSNQYGWFGGGLFILDVSDPTNPTQVSITEIRDDGMAVTVVGSVAYVAGRNWTLAFDVSDPAAPRELGYYQLGRNSYDIAADGSNLYVAAGEGGLRVLDISNPESLTQIGSYEPPTNADALDVVGNRAYLTDSDSSHYYSSHANRLHIVDLSNPSEPTLLALDVDRAYGWDIAVQENRAYFLGRSDYHDETAIFDLSEPSEPQSLGSLRTSDFSARIVVSGNYAYIADRAYGIRILDVSDPTTPREVGAYRLSDNNTEAHDVIVAGNYAYVAVAAGGSDTPTNNGLYVLDISDPSAPRRVGFLKTEGHNKDDSQFRSSLALVGSHVYLAENIRHSNGGYITYTSALRIINVSSPTAPELIGSYETTPSLGGVAAAAGFVFVAEGKVWDQQAQRYTYLGGVRVLDVRNPASPLNVGFYDVREVEDSIYQIHFAVRDIVLEGNRLYVTSKLDGLLVLTSRYLSGGDEHLYLPLIQRAP